MSSYIGNKHRKKKENSLETLIIDEMFAELDLKFIDVLQNVMKITISNFGTFINVNRLQSGI